MSVALIQARLLSYKPQTVLDQENALKEIAQEIALSALSRAGFFRVAAFQGGTCLRILYELQRFSEDLDFILQAPDKSFAWNDYVHTMNKEFSSYGFTLEVKDRSKLDNNVKMAFLKADSEGGILVLRDSGTNRPQLRIKLEIDTNPPMGSEFELKYLDFPLPYSINSQDLPSLFASKCHASLCRKYIKGRDWYDMIWYVAKQVPVNFKFLTNAIEQAGPWKNKNIIVTPDWLLQQLETKIKQIDWGDAKQDVARFLKPAELTSLELWSKEFFLSRLDKLAKTFQKISPILS